MAVIEENFSSFGVVLKTFRKRRHLTQQQLAKVIGVHRSTLINWEQGDFLPGSKTMVLELARHLKLDDQEGRQLLEASLTMLAPHWFVPYPRNHYFTGREEILETLHAQLGADQAVVLTQSSALHGLGGIGKTQIALEYAYRHALEYSAVFWIGAETEEQVISSLLHIAEALQLPEQEDKDQQRVVTATQRWFTTHGQWLLIWDNVEDLAILDRFLPSVRSGAILITTRCQTLGTFARGLDLLPMEHEEGMLFLLRRAKVLAPEATHEQVRQLATRMPAQYRAAEELVKTMGGLPLALDQTGAYLEATQCGLPAYLELFRTRHAALLKQRGESSRDHPASVSTTFTLAITATAQRHPAVWDLLRVCALLQPDAIPEELFRQGGEHLGTTLEAVCHDELEWNGVIAVAGSYSLLSRQPEAQTLSMHRLVQAVLLQQMSEQEQADWLQRTIVALNAVYPETAPNVWDLCERLLPHVLTCGDAVPDHVGNLQVVEMLRKAADYLRVRAQFKLAGSLYQRAVHIGEQVLGPEHPGLAKALNGLAIIYASQGKYKLAEPHFQRALYIWEQVQGSEHRQVVIPLNNLASLYVQQGEYGLAEPLYQRALHINEQALGPEHPELGHPLGGLADIYFEQGRYELAAQLHQRVLSIRERAEGPESLMLAFPLNNLADLYTKQGKVEQAELLYRRAVHICEQTLGLEHPYVTTPLNGLANLFREQDKDMEAESLFQRALRIREQHLGQGHPDTAQTLYDLAIFRQKQGNLSEAVSLTQRVLSIRSQSLGEAHPKTVATRMLHAQLVQEQAAGAAKTALEQDAETMTGVCSEEHQADGASLSPLRRVDVSSSTSDPLHAFLDACCELHPRAWCRSADLWQAYEHWAEEHQERYPLSRGAFLTQVKAHGCRADRTKAMRIWRGITLVKKNDDGR